MLSSSTVSRIGMRMYRSNRSRRRRPWSSSHSMARLRIRFTPSERSSSTCSSEVSSGPRKRKFGRMVDTVNIGNGSSVVGGWEVSGRAVDGEREEGVVGERSMRGVVD